ncbi:COX15/CtaA family protein [Larkinella humicola]|uniref:Heme A synthase n=1 Tax=Larkinella humicola TaxID=2607654 RepID=A0A5N1JLA7_9BACT|nr:COX15/CtaA family protein [Larkinella humicola]KAA9353834.1 heme A synthase [Larkinella humicola]
MTSSSSLTNQREHLFRRLALLTVITIYLLILAGGIVRSTGSGMGCPDWPRCFGRWIPPTEVSQLPLNYQEIYGAKLKGEVEFNPVKTWIEYVNRLLGAFAGLLVFALLLVSIPYLKSDKRVFYWSFISFVLIGLNGWLGSRVVATELAPYLVTLHMLLAILVVFALLYVMAISYTGRVHVEPISKKKRVINQILLWAMVLSVVQVLIGTQVRESIDEVIQRIGYSERYRWMDSLDFRFYIHRSFSLVILVFHVAVIYQLRKHATTKGLLSQLITALMIMVVVEILTGIILAYFAVPAAAQPIHLTLAIIILGLQFIALLVLNANQLLRNRAVQQPIYSKL